MSNLRISVLQKVIYTYGYNKYSMNMEQFNKKYPHDKISMEVRPSRFSKNNRRYCNGYEFYVTDMWGTKRVEHIEDVFATDLASNAIEDYIVAWHNELVSIEQGSGKYAKK